MATYKVEAPDGSIIVLEGPANATDAEIGQAAQAAYAQKQPKTASEPPRVEVSGVPIFAESSKASTITPPAGFKLLPIALADAKPSGSYYDEALNAWLTPVEPSTTATGLAGAVTRGVALPAAGAALGAAMGAPFAGVGAIPGAIAGAGAATLAGLIGDPIISGVNTIFGTKYTLPTDALEDLLTRVGVAEPRTAAERIVQTTAAGGAGAGGLAAAGKAIETAAGLTAPVTREVGRMIATQPAMQVAGGAGGGVAAQTFAEATKGTEITPLGQVAGTVASSLAGGMAGARLARPKPTPLPPTAQPIVTEAESLGVPVLTSDVLQPQSFIGKIAQRIGERVPMAGTGPVRAEQQKARIEAVRNVLREYGADDAANLSDNIMKDLATKRSAEIQKYSQSKKEVINRLADKGTVPVPRALAAIDDQIADLARRRTEGSDEAIKRLEQIKKDLQNRDLFQIEAYRQDELAKIFMDDPARPMSIAARDAGEKALRAVYGPVREDMIDFIKKTGERRDADKFLVANKRLNETANELKMTALKSVLKSGEQTPEVVNRLLFGQKPSEIRQLYKGLTPEGRANARSSILSQAASKAEDVLPDGTKIFSPEKFNAELKRLQPQISVFFKGDDLQRVQGLSRVLTMTRRAGEAGVTTATGQEAVPFVAGSFLRDIFGSFGASLAAAGGIGATARIYESAPVRDLLMKIPKTAPGGTEEAKLFKRLMSTIQTQANLLPAEQVTQENK